MIDQIVVSAVGISVLGFLGWLRLVHDWREIWETVGSRCSLSLDTSELMPPRLRGSRAGCEVVVARSRLKISIQVRDVDPWFTLERGSGNTRRSQPGIETGDPQFDERVRVEGDHDFALGLLNSETRRAVEDVVLSVGATVRDGKMQAWVHRIREVPRALEPMLHLGPLLRRPVVRDLAPRLARSALEDPSQGFRQLAFRQLVESFPESDELQSTAKNLLYSGRGKLRLEAARIVVDCEDPKDRRAAVDALAEMAASRNLEASTRRTALQELTRSDHAEVATRVAGRLLVRPDERSEMRSAAITALAEAGAIEDLLELDPPEDPTWALSEHEAEWLADGLARLGDVRAQPRLVELLAHRRDSVRIAAARALGAVGDVGAVRSLRQAAEDRLLLSSPLAEAVEQAVARIQARAGGAQAGEIAIVEPGPLEGAVSVAEDDGCESGPEGGEVSLAD